jgi:uncharacterized protein (DUF924 family)
MVEGEAPEIAQVLEFWFAPGREKQWFVKDAAFDREVDERLGALHAKATTGAFEAWQASARGCLALVILFDQVPRNIHRGGAEAYAYDWQALAVLEQALAKGLDQQLSELERWFFYLPLEHSEDLDHQDRCVALMSELANSDRLRWAIAHRDVIARFGRFPHRNAALGRESTAEEAEFLTQPDSSF